MLSNQFIIIAHPRNGKLITKYEGMIYNVADNIGLIANYQLKNQQYLRDNDMFTPENNAISRILFNQGISKQFQKKSFISFIKVSEDGKESYINILLNNILIKVLQNCSNIVQQHIRDCSPTIHCCCRLFYICCKLIACCDMNIAHSYLDYPI